MKPKLSERDEKVLRNSLITLHNKLSEAKDMRDYLKQYNRSLDDPSPFNAYSFMSVKEHIDRLKRDIEWYNSQIKNVQEKLRR